MARRRRIVSLALVAALSLAHSPVATAQFFGGVVYDPTNHVQNFRTAIHNYAQLVRQAQQLRNEANMLINQAKHLSKLDLNSVNDLNRILGEIAYLNSQAENVAYDVNRTRQLLREHYPELANCKLRNRLISLWACSSNSPCKPSKCKLRRLGLIASILQGAWRLKKNPVPG